MHIVRNDTALNASVSGGFYPTQLRRGPLHVKNRFTSTFMRIFDVNEREGGQYCKGNGAVTVQKQTAHGWPYTTIVTKLEEDQPTASCNLLKSI